VTASPPAETAALYCDTMLLVPTGLPAPPAEYVMALISEQRDELRLRRR
jgi:hypothetical protein